MVSVECFVLGLCSPTLFGSKAGGPGGAISCWRFAWQSPGLVEGRLGGGGRFLWNSGCPSCESPHLCPPSFSQIHLSFALG